MTNVLETDFNLWRKVNFLNEQLQHFAQKHRPKDNEGQNTLEETLTLVEMAKHNKPPCVEICARMRAAALKMQDASPVITAYLEHLAEHYETKRH